jgi:hypothetical protein
MDRSLQWSSLGTSRTPVFKTNRKLATPVGRRTILRREIGGRLLFVVLFRSMGVASGVL